MTGNGVLFRFQRTPACMIVPLLLFVSAAAAQTPILQYGRSATGSIECGRTNQYTLNGNQGDKLVIHVTETVDYGGCACGRCTCDFDQYVDIRSDQDDVISLAFTPLDHNRCAHRTRTQVGPITLPRTGRYTISVRDANNYGRGSYVISVQRTNVPLESEPLNLNDSRLVSLNTPGELRAFILNVEANTPLSIQMIRDTGNVVPRLALYNSSGDAVALPEAGQIQQTILQSGFYTLIAYSALNEQGAYRITTSTRPLSNQMLSQVVDGGGWQTVITLVNNGTEEADYTLRFWSETGSEWFVAWDGPVSGIVPPLGSRTIRSPGREAETRKSWAELITSKRIGMLAIFRSPAGQEAAVMGTNATGRFLLPFDNTQQLVTAMAVVNSSDVRPALVRVTFRNEAGSILGADDLSIAARGHRAFAIQDQFPRVRNIRGVAEFVSDVPALTALGLRFSPNGAFTSVPVQPLGQ